MQFIVVFFYSFQEIKKSESNQKWLVVWNLFEQTCPLMLHAVRVVRDGHTQMFIINYKYIYIFVFLFVHVMFKPWKSETRWILISKSLEKENNLCWLIRSLLRVRYLTTMWLSQPLLIFNCTTLSQWMSVSADRLPTRALLLQC